MLGPEIIVGIPVWLLRRWDEIFSRAEIVTISGISIPNFLPSLWHISPTKQLGFIERYGVSVTTFFYRFVRNLPHIYPNGVALRGVLWYGDLKSQCFHWCFLLYCSRFACLPFFRLLLTTYADENYCNYNQYKIPATNV